LKSEVPAQAIHQKPKSNTSRNVVIVVLVVIAVGIVGYYLYSSSSNSNVTVSGAATITGASGASAQPVSVIFTSDTGHVYVATINAGNFDYFSISLPNFQTYSTTITLKGGGTCNAPTFSLSEMSGGPGVTEDLSCYVSGN
jgi:uncharacterized protein (UPF0333 family)